MVWGVFEGWLWSEHAFGVPGGYVKVRHPNERNLELT